MNMKNSSRASDVGELLLTGSTGFTVRKRTGVGMFVHFFLLSCMVILGAALLVYYKSPQGCMLAVVIGGCFSLISHNMEKLKKVKQSIEFMNALFSSALGKGHSFCFIVKNTGDIVFYNRPFQAIFPAYVAQSNRNIDTLLALYQVPADDRAAVKAHLAASGDANISTTISAIGTTESAKITFEIEQIERPTGFFIIRGK